MISLTCEIQKMDLIEIESKIGSKNPEEQSEEEIDKDGQGY